MTRILVVGAALAAMALIANCGSFTAASDAPVANEAGAETSAPVVDAGADADPYADCTLLFEDDFSGTTLDPAWKPVQSGGAMPKIIGMQAVLVDGSKTNAVGGIWRQISLDPGKDLVVDVTLNDDTIMGSSADGFAIAWAPSSVAASNGKIPVGGFGNSLGICGSATGPAHTIALAIPTFLNSINDNDPRSLRLYETDNAMCQLLSPLVPYTLAMVMPTTLRISQGAISGTVNGATITESVPHTDIAWLGFTAATGGTTSTESLSDVRVHACPPKTH